MITSQLATDNIYCVGQKKKCNFVTKTQMTSPLPKKEETVFKRMKFIQNTSVKKTKIMKTKSIQTTQNIFYSKTYSNHSKQKLKK